MNKGQLYLMLKWHLGMTSEEIADATGRSKRTAEGWSGNTPGKEPPQQVINILVDCLEKKIAKQSALLATFKRDNRMLELQAEAYAIAGERFMLSKDEHVAQITEKIGADATRTLTSLVSKWRELKAA